MRSRDAQLHKSCSSRASVLTLVGLVVFRLRIVWYMSTRWTEERYLRSEEGLCHESEHFKEIHFETLNIKRSATIFKIVRFASLSTTERRRRRRKRRALSL